MSKLTPYGTPIARSVISNWRKNGEGEELYNGGRVQLDVMNDLLYRSTTIDSIVVDKGDWKPDTFRSSRQNKYVHEEENVEKYMDDDDMRNWEARRVLVPVVGQRSTQSIAREFLEYVKWRQKKTSTEEEQSVRLYQVFQGLTRPIGSKKGLFTASTTLVKITSRKRPIERERKVKKQRINMKLSISEDYEEDDYKKHDMPSTAKLDEMKPKFIPRSNRLLTQKPANTVSGEKGTSAFKLAAKIPKYDTYKWPNQCPTEVKQELETKLETKLEVKPEGKPDIIPLQDIPQDISKWKITVQAFRKLSIVPPLNKDIASDALGAESMPFNSDLDRQLRYIYFLKVQAEMIPNNSFFEVPTSLTLDAWKHELNEFTQLALRYRPLSFELAQRFAPATNQPVEIETKIATRTVENFIPVPLLLTRFGLPQIKDTPKPAIVPEVSTETPPPLKSNIINLYENPSLMGKAPHSLFEKIFKNAT